MCMHCFYLLCMREKFSIVQKKVRCVSVILQGDKSWRGRKRGEGGLLSGLVAGTHRGTSIGTMTMTMLPEGQGC